MEQFLLFSTIFCYLLLDFHVKTGTRFSLQDKWLFEISKVKITRVDCISSLIFIVLNLQVLSVVVNVLRYMYLRDYVGDWTEMIVTLQVCNLVLLLQILEEN